MTSPLHGSVLLADDEEGILKTLGRALREDGHQVTATASAAEAARLLAERPLRRLRGGPPDAGAHRPRSHPGPRAAVPETERPRSS